MNHPRTFGNPTHRDALTGNGALNRHGLLVGIGSHDGVGKPKRIAIRLELMNACGHSRNGEDLANNPS